MFCVTRSILLTSVVIIQLSEDRKWVIWLGWKQNPQKLPSPTKFFLFFKRERLVCGNFYTKTLIMKDDKVDCVYEN